MSTHFFAPWPRVGTLNGVDRDVTDLLHQTRPVGVRVDDVKRELAIYWLGRPRGVWARLVWALRLAFVGGGL